MLNSHLYEAADGVSPYVAGNAAAPEMSGDVLGDTLAMMGSAMSFERNEELFAEEEPADYVYKVVSGVVRTCKFLEDGRRQIGEFHFPGDVFGFEPCANHTFSAEAVTPCRVVIVKRAALMAAAGRDAELGSALWIAATRELGRLHEHMVLLGRKSARERVMAFLASAAERQCDAAVIDIPMSRQDIADHLGLTIETVSRTMTQLQETGAISLEGSRRVRVGPVRLAA
ncbi:cyclic nucleotide-binding domain-containing protein [Kaustia mangrovi]|nr:cyclic nucleotide-binding domain-containing protein [Kaustia mangrovi]